MGVIEHPEGQKSGNETFKYYSNCLKHISILGEKHTY